MMSNGGCWRRRLAVLVIAANSPSGCATVGFESPSSTCPLVVEYSRAEQARVAKELATLPEDALIGGWLADYAVMRDQARACLQYRSTH